MIYSSDEDLLIRTISESGTKVLCTEEIAQGRLGATEQKYLRRLTDNASGKSIALIAEYKGRVAGYVNVYSNTIKDDAANKEYCNIVDFGGLKKYRNHGVGSRLMHTAEQIASEYADTVFIGVALHSGYGSAQRMYVKRGYIPDGKGVWYGPEVRVPYQTIVMTTNCPYA